MVDKIMQKCTKGNIKDLMDVNVWVKKSTKKDKISKKKDEMRTLIAFQGSEGARKHVEIIIRRNFPKATHAEIDTYMEWAQKHYIAKRKGLPNTG